jgi:hypothetical protein
MQDEMMDLMDVSNEIQETLGRSYNVPDDIDEEELMGGMPQFPILLFLDNLHIYTSCMFQLDRASLCAVLIPSLDECRT